MGGTLCAADENVVDPALQEVLEVDYKENVTFAISGCVLCACGWGQKNSTG